MSNENVPSPAVAIGSVGRFHAFDLAAQLNAQGCLSRLYTCYWANQIDGVPKSRISSFPLAYSLNNLYERVAPTTAQRIRHRGIIGSFDYWMSHRLQRCDLFHCLSGFGTRAHEVARSRYGAVTFCDRGSTHILHQDEILKEEFEKWGARYPGVDPWIVERELEEYEACDRIIVPSRFVANTFRNRGIKDDRLLLCPYGVDVSLFHRVAPRDSDFRILFAGMVCLRKGIQYLLEAVSQLPRGRFQLWIAGSIQPDARPILEKYTGLFEYLGVVPRKEMATYYSRASVLVLPSLEEGLALVQAQALACGLPVIATPNSGAEDLFEDGVSGLLVPSRSAKDLRDQLLELSTNAVRLEELSAQAVQCISRIGGWAAYGQKMRAHYQSVLRRAN